MASHLVRLCTYSFQDIVFSLQEEESLPANLLGHWLSGNALAQPSLCLCHWMEWYTHIWWRKPD